MKNQFANSITIGKNSAIPMGDKMIPAGKTKWSKYAHPEFARFKAVVYWADSGIGSPYFSYEGAKNMTEEQGYADIMRRVVKGKNPDLYTTIVLYMNATDDLRTSQKNFSYEICCYMAGRPSRTERKIIFDPAGKVNIQATKEINS